MNRKTLLSVIFSASTILFAPSAHAATLFKFDLSGAGGGDLSLDSGTLTTIDDGNALTLGDQDTTVLFEGPLSFLNDSGGSFTLEGIAVTDPSDPSAPGGSLATSGGTFSFWDANNTLLLTGQLDSGLLSYSLISGTGSFFNTQNALFTGGTLLQYVLETPAGFSLALANINLTQGTGFSFKGDADGLVTGSGVPTEVPEPSTVTLLLSGLVGFSGYRGKSRRA